MYFERQRPAHAIAGPIGSCVGSNRDGPKGLAHQNDGLVPRPATPVGGRRLARADIRPFVIEDRSHHSEDPANGQCDIAPIDSAVWRRWTGLITSIVAGLWLKMLRKRRMRRVRVAWATIDDRTLKDIGISRLEMAYARISQPSDCGDESH